MSPADVVTLIGAGSAALTSAAAAVVSVIHAVKAQAATGNQAAREDPGPGRQ